MSGFIEASISERRDWAPGLMTLRLAAELDPFEPGQWVNLALRAGDELVRRAYSLASPPGQPPELYLALVPEGRLSPLLFALSVQDRVLVERKPQGFFTLRWVPPAQELWLVATGTGLGPYLSLLRSPEIWQRFARVVLVHGARQAAGLGYREELEDRARARGGQLVYVPVLTRDPDAPGVLHGRITAALASGELERAAGTALSTERSHLMLCGNPEMIRDLSELLEARGLHKHRPRRPGHVTTESYW